MVLATNPEGRLAVGLATEQGEGQRVRLSATFAGGPSSSGGGSSGGSAGGVNPAPPPFLSAELASKADVAAELERQGLAVVKDPTREQIEAAVPLALWSGEQVSGWAQGKAGGGRELGLGGCSVGVLRQGAALRERAGRGEVLAWQGSGNAGHGGVGEASRGWVTQGRVQRSAAQLSLTVEQSHDRDPACPAFAGGKSRELLLPPHHYRVVPPPAHL